MPNGPYKPISQSLVNTSFSSSIRKFLGNMTRRALDICISLLGIILLAPFLLFIRYQIKRDSPGPVFFRGLRAGMNNKNFHILKFRTMYENDESYQGPTVTAQDDPRITPFGQWLRDMKVNELPQLWNVFKGDMSLVGPRPETPEIVASWPKEIREEILSVRPGVTSPSSVIYRNEESLLKSDKVMSDYLRDILPSKIRLDLLYVRNRSVLADMDVLFWTLVVLLTRVSSSTVPEHLLYWGPLSRFIDRHFTWFLLDLIVSFVSVAFAGTIWRLSAPYHLGVEVSIGIALTIALLFSILNTVVGINRTSWSKASAREAIDLALSSGLVTAFLFFFNLYVPGGPILPPGMLVVSGMFSFFGFIAVRYRSRLIAELANRWIKLRPHGLQTFGERIVIVGSGELGSFTLWLLRNSTPEEALSIAGMVDDNPRKIGMKIDRCQVIGSTKDIPELVDKLDLGLIIFAISDIQTLEQHRIMSLSQHTNARIIHMPDILDTLNAQIQLNGFDRNQMYKKVILNSTIDKLTGVYNRQQLLYLAEHELRRARRYGYPLAIINFTIDYKRPQESTYALALGSKVISTVIDRCKVCIRDVDIVGRYDTNEFALLMPETNLAGAQKVADRLLHCMTDEPVITDTIPLDVIVHMSVSSDEKKHPSAESFLDYAHSGLNIEK
ncbi:sugar transferase [bacterium]|nr:sugar transferase [bacterium]